MTGYILRDIKEYLYRIAGMHLSSITGIHSNKSENDANYAKLHVAQEYRRRGMFQQLLKIDSGKTRHHAGSTDCRQTNQKALLRRVHSSSGLCRLKLDNGDSNEEKD